METSGLFYWHFINGMKQKAFAIRVSSSLTIINSRLPLTDLFISYCN